MERPDKEMLDWNEPIAISLASMNEAKESGVRRAFGLYWKTVTVTTYPASGESPQPLGWEAMFASVTQRLYARPPDEPSDFTVALEAGIVPNLGGEGDFGFSVAGIVARGAKEIFFGISPGFPIPLGVMDIVTKGIELTPAFRQAHALDPNDTCDVIEMLTANRYSRADLEFTAVIMALSQIVSADASRGGRR